MSSLTIKDTPIETVIKNTVTETIANPTLTNGTYGGSVSAYQVNIPKIQVSNNRISKVENSKVTISGSHCSYCSYCSYCNAQCKQCANCTTVNCSYNSRCSNDTYQSNCDCDGCKD